MTIQVDNKFHFGHSIFQTELPDFLNHQQGLIDAILKLKDLDDGISRSNQGGWHSHDQLQTEQNPALQWLKQQLIDIGTKCIAHAEGERLSGRILLSSCWANINPFGAWNAPHMHLPCEWSGVCYLKIKEIVKLLM